jgi:hypothetical protein
LENELRKLLSDEGDCFPSSPEDQLEVTDGAPGGSHGRTVRGTQGQKSFDTEQAQLFLRMSTRLYHFQSCDARLATYPHCEMFSVAILITT